MTPPIASISLIRCPFPNPPIAGLQDITPISSLEKVTIATFMLSLLAITAASTPAWPPPITKTS